MDLSEIYVIVSDWYGQGVISDANRQLLKEEYLRQLGQTSRCTTCPAFWHDVLVHFRIQLKNESLAVMSNRKYMIADGGNLLLPGDPNQYINEGKDGNGNVVLTDEIATEIIKRHPTYAELIVINPDYKEPAKKNEGAESKK